MINDSDKILLSYGSGGKRSHELINDLFFRYFDNKILLNGGDSAILHNISDSLAFTTDSFVVDPLFFPGGDIGKLAVCGTVNDLAVSGAVPKYLSVGFIIEEGLDFDILNKVVKSMAETAQKTNVLIVTGDTKVVQRGTCDKLYINTSGIGDIEPKFKMISSGEKIRVGDKILINGFIADHGIAVMSARNKLKVQTDVKSDCASLKQLIQEVLNKTENINFMRDATRGGIATVAAEIVKNKKFGISLSEDQIPVRENVRGMCEFFGFDPLYVANEGKAFLIVSPKDAELVVNKMRRNVLGKETRIIGEVVADHPGKVVLKTRIGGKRIIDMLVGDQLPRIC